MARSMARVYVGDIGTIIQRTPIQTLPSNVDTTKLSYREQCNLLVSLGVDVRDIIGKSDCLLHVNMILLADKIMPEGFNLFEDCLYCKNCWRLFRNKEHIAMD